MGSQDVIYKISRDKKAQVMSWSFRMQEAGSWMLLVHVREALDPTEQDCRKEDPHI